MHSYEILLWIGLLFTLLFVFGFSLRFLKVPYILSFMLAGLVGKELFPERVIEWVTFLEHSAVIFLFFFIGLEYSFERLGAMRNILKPGLADLFINFLSVFIVAYLATKDFIFSTVVASALYPSSTAITAKLLSDYKRLVFLEAELLIGTLIFEDLISIILLSLLSGGTNGKQGEPTLLLLRSVLSLIVFFFAFYFLRNLAYKAVGEIDRISEETIFPFLIVGTLLLLCGLGEWMGVSSALIAFMLGVIVPEDSLTYKTVEERLVYLKELSLGVFFFSFTYSANISFDQNFYLLITLLLLSLIAKIISTYWGARLYGLSKKVSIRASLSFLARGEFSLIFANLLPATQALVFLVVLITSILGSITFVYAPRVASALAKPKG